MRQRIIRGLESNNMLEVAHHEMVYGILNEDIQLSMHGLRDHFGYIEKYRA